MSKRFPRNESAVDRMTRVIVGIGLLSIVFVGPATPWGWVGLVRLITGRDVCPIAHSRAAEVSWSPREGGQVP